MFVALPSIVLIHTAKLMLGVSFEPLKLANSTKKLILTFYFHASISSGLETLNIIKFSIASLLFYSLCSKAISKLDSGLNSPKP